MAIYWWILISKLAYVSQKMMIVSGFASALIIFLYYVSLEEPFHKTTNSLKQLKLFSVSLFFLFLIIYVLCPNRTDLALMFGWDALKSETAQEVFDIVKERLK